MGEKQQQQKTRVYTFVVECARGEVILFEDVPLVEFMYLVFTLMPVESYRRRLRSLLLYLYYVFLVLINSRVC